MNIVEGNLKRNSIGRWEIENLEFTSGAALELLVEGNWIPGNIESWNGEYYWFSRTDGIPVVLHSGIKARAKPGRYTNG